jgi:hypothetical protein
MLKRMATLFATAALCCATAALAQEQQSKTTPTRANEYSVARESNLQGKVVKYIPDSVTSTAPAGANVELETSSGIVNVHLGNARLLTANHLSLEPGDAVTIVGETLPYGEGTVFAARIIQKGTLSVTVRSKNGIPLKPTSHSGNAEPSPAGAR